MCIRDSEWNVEDLASGAFLRSVRLLGGLSGRGFGGFACDLAGRHAGAFAAAEAGLEGLHEVDDLGVRGFGRGDRDFLAFDLLLDDLEHALADRVLSLIHISEPTRL